MLKIISLAPKIFFGTAGNNCARDEYYFIKNRCKGFKLLVDFISKG
jgi:hypothetical protein